MKHHSRYAAIAAALCCSHFNTYGEALPSATVELVNPTAISIKGIITPHSAEKFKSLLSPSINTVLISNEGGVTEAALDIAEEIQRRQLGIEVIDFCASSCANYIFVAGSTKIVHADAIVGWHGGHSFKPFRAQADSKERLIEKEKLLLREQLLYARAGTSMDLIIYSGLLTLGEHVSGKISREYTLWTPDPVELTRLGVKNIYGTFAKRSPTEINGQLEKMGFRNQSVYTGTAYSYLPGATSKH